MFSVLAAAMMQASAPAVIPPFGTAWAERPGLSDLERYFPEAAAKESLAGQATLACRVEPNGRLADCAVEASSPKDAGFEEAALKMAGHFTMRSEMRPAGGVVRLQILMRLPGEFRSARIDVRHPQVSGQFVAVDCRFRDSHLDNCFARGMPDAKAADVAVGLATGVSLPPMPRPRGRVVLPLFFVMAPPPPDARGERPASVTNPDWIRRPAGIDLARVYPKEASRRGIQGDATTSCNVNKEGRLVDCMTLDESPLFSGFGDAALRMMPLFQMRPQTRSGVPVDGGVVRIPIRFTLPQ